MPSSTEKPKNNKKDSELRDVIYAKVTKKIHNHESPKKNGDGTLKKCIELFKQGADPSVLSTLEKSLSEQIESAKSPKQKEEYQKHYKYYIKNFLPALKDEVIRSEELAKPPVLNNERKQSQRPQTKRGKIVGIILGIINKNNNKDHSSSIIQNQNGRRNSQNSEESGNKNIIPSQLLDSEPDSGVGSREPSEENLESPINSRRSSLTLVTSTSSEESVNSIPSVAEENNNLQKENENQMQPEQAAPEEPQVQESVNSDGQANPDQVKEELSQVSLQRLTLGSREKESLIPVSATRMTDDDHTKDPVKSEEKKDKKNTITTVQKLPVNEKKGEVKQPNNRNLHVALVAGCALSTIGCIVAGAMTSGLLVGAGLLAMAAVFAIAAVAELRSNFLSSKLTSINVSPLVDDKELTAL